MRSAARRALSFDRPASSGAIASNSSISFSDSSKRPVFANDLTARSSIAKRWTVPGSRGIAATWREYTICLCRLVASIPRHFGFDFFRPFVDAADEVLHLTEAQLPKEVRDASGADSGLTVHDNFIRGVQLIDPTGDLSHRHQNGPIEVGDLPLHRFTNVQEDDLVALVESLLQRIDRDLEFLSTFSERPPEPPDFFLATKPLEVRIPTQNGPSRVLRDLQVPD